MLFLLLTVLFFASCQKERSCEGCIEAAPVGRNAPPVANAGPDQDIVLPVSSATLNGSSSADPDGNIASYAWVQISGPEGAVIADSGNVRTAVTGFVGATYSFELTVTDSTGLSSKDTMSITVSATDEQDGRWKRLHSLPENDFFRGRNYINFLLGIDDKIFAIGKNGSFWSYDPQKDEWKGQGNLPNHMVSANFSVVFSVNGKGYLIGNGTCRQYDAVTGEWTIKNNAPTGANHVDYSVPLVIGDKVYLVASTNNKVTLYDPVADTYTLKNDFPDVSPAAGFVINGDGYCVQQNGRCWKYDPLTDSWQQKGSLPPSIYNMSGFSLNNYGYIIGDLDRAAYNGIGKMKIWRYDATADEWKLLDEEYPGDGAYAVKTTSLNGIVYAGLGYNDDGLDAIDFWKFQ